MPGTKDDDKNKSTVNIAPVDQPTKQDKAPDKDAPPDKDKKPEEQLILGRYKSSEDLAKAHTDLEKKLGTQGKELGALRNQIAQHEAAKAEAAKKETKAPETDYDARINEIYQKLDDGDISVAEALKQSNAITAEIVRKQAVEESNKRTQDILLDKDAEAAESEWHKQHPDYNEVVASGVLQPYIDKNPILVDETIAYFQYKADQRFEDGKAEAERIAKGAAEADTVVKETGVITKTPTRQEPLSDDKLLASQMETLKKIRGQA